MTLLTRHTGHSPPPPCIGTAIPASHIALSQHPHGPELAVPAPVPASSCPSLSSRRYTHPSYQPTNNCLGVCPGSL